MLPQADATIYLAAQRGCSQTAQYRSYRTLNFGNYFNETKKPVGRVLALNEETFAGEATQPYHVSENTTVLILPLVGITIVKTKSGIQYVEAGQAYTFFVELGDGYEISNPYRAELICFLHIWIRSDLPISVTQNLDLQKQQNQLLSLTPERTTRPGVVGQFEARQEGTYTTTNPDAVLVFVVEGVFEVENRLLQQGDALALRHVGSLEFEALSRDAIILILE